MAMATPPTITVSAFAGAPTSTVASSTYLRYDSLDGESGGSPAGPFATFLGGVPVSYQAAGHAVVSNVSLAGTPEYPVWALEFIHDGQVVELVFYGNASYQSYRIIMDGQAVALAPTIISAAGQYQTVKVDKGARSVTRFRIEFDRASFGGIFRGPQDVISTVALPGDRVAFLGDSYTAGVGTTSQINGWVWGCAQRMRWRNTWNIGIGGTGWLNNGGGGSKRVFQSRLADDALQVRPDILVTMGGINDLPSVNAAYTAAALQTAVSAYLAAAFTTLPTLKQVYIIGCQQPQGPTAEKTAATSAIKAACLGVAGVTFIDPTGWITGTGKVGAATGTGNADFCTYTDGVHPTDEGHAYLASRIADAMYASLAA
jgi:lysophospholipase L1-like esterase